MNTIGPIHNPERARVLALGGGKGGAGRSTLCAELARSLVRHGQRVLCVDTSPSCPNLHTFLHAAEPSYDHGPDDPPPLGMPGSHVADFIEETGHRSIWLTSLAAARGYPYIAQRMDPYELLEQLHELDFDWILIDLPAGLDPFSVSLFTLCDLPTLVCSPEPAAVRVTTQFLRSSIFHALDLHPNADLVDTPLTELLASQAIDMTRDALLEDAWEPELERIVLDTLARLEIYLIVNLVREGAERDLGFVLSHAWHQRLGVFPRFLTPVDYEDRRWFYHRRAGGAASSRGDEALSSDIERLVRHLSQIDSIDRRYPRPVPSSPDAPPALRLGLAADLGPNELRQHCRRLWEGYRREATVSLIFDDDDARAVQADAIERLYKSQLTLPGEHAPEQPLYHRAAAPATTSRPTAPTPHDPSNPSDSPPPPLPSPPSRTDRMRSPGQTIARLRRQHGFSLGELSSRTHIGLKYLAAIEDTDLDILPRPVYLSGYLREIARTFGVEPQPLIDEYFRLLDELRGGS